MHRSASGIVTARRPSSGYCLPLEALEEDRELAEPFLAERGELRHRRARDSRRTGTSGAGSGSRCRGSACRSSVRSGAPRFDEPLPRYVWQAVQPEVAKSFAPGTAAGGSFSSLTQRRHVGDHLGGERLLRRRALPGQHRHREDDEHRGDDGDRPPRQPPLAAHVVERQRDQQHEQDRRHADRAEEHRVRPLEDPEQVEEEVEVPVRPRDEVRRPRVGRRGVLRAEQALVQAVVMRRRTTSTSR